MGKGALISVLGISFLALFTLNQARLISQESSQLQTSHHAEVLAKELAVKGRKLVLSSWISSKGASGSYPFTSIAVDGGTITLDTLSLENNLLSFTVQGEYEGASHRISSNLEWHTFSINPLQISVPEFDFEVEPTATLDFDTIVIDDLSLTILDDFLIQELSLADSLGEFDLGMQSLIQKVAEALSPVHAAIHVESIDAADRNLLEQEYGMFYPSQALQLIENHILSFPASELVVSEAASIPSTFGQAGPNILRVENDVTLPHDVTGEGIIIIEGDFKVPEDITFDWKGIVIVHPPEGTPNGSVDLKGFVDINGSVVIIQEGVPNSGHMDFTINYDALGIWSNPWGQNNPWYKHTHDFSGKQGTRVGFISNQQGFTVHDGQSRFVEILNTLSSSDEIILELHNPHNHGMASLTIDVTGKGYGSYPVSAGFPPAIADPTHPYRTLPFKKSALNHLDIAVTRLSALKKTWDTPDPYPNCMNHDMGPNCVGVNYDRYGALGLRMYHKDGATEKHLYDASLYWHRRMDELDKFEQEMNDLLDYINSSEYGMNIYIGPNTTITVNQEAAHSLRSIEGALPINITNHGTWHRHWSANDPENPSYVGSVAPDSAGH